MADEWKPGAREDPGVRSRRVLGYVAGFLGFAAVLFGVLNVYYRTILTGHSIDVSVRDFPAPRLQPNPDQDYVDFHTAQVRELDRSGAVSPSVAGQSLIRLPIEKAMAVVVARGARAYDPVEGTPAAAPALATGAPIDGAPRTAVSPAVAPFGRVR